MWKAHLLRLLERAWLQVLAWNSATTFSIAKEAIIVPFLVLLVALWWTLRGDWYKPSAIKLRGLDVLRAFVITIGVLLALVGLCFIVAIPAVIFQDHMDLVGTNTRLKETNKQLAAQISGRNSKAATSQPPELSPYVYYRHITQEQSNDIITALGKFKASTIGIYTSTWNKEQVSYTEELSDVFHQAGWTIIPGRPIDKADAAWLGLDSGLLRHSGVSIVAAGELSPDPALSALTAAKIPHQIVRDLKNQTSFFYSGGINKSMLILFVGPKEEPAR